MILEDKDICKKCRDKCCEKSGCDYYVEDFQNFQLDYLLNRLEEGNISIVAALGFDYVGNKVVCSPILYLRARNEGKGIVDLLSIKTRCAVLTENGCPYTFNERPSGGKFFVPKENGKCYPLMNQKEKILEWKAHQKILHRLVKRITGKTVDENLREDVFNVLYKVLCNDFHNVSQSEIEDLCSLIPWLKKAYPEEARRAAQLYDKSYYNILKLKPRNY